MGAVPKASVMALQCRQGDRTKPRETRRGTPSNGRTGISLVRGLG